MELTPNLWPMLTKATWESFYMVSVSSLLTCLFGIPWGILIVITRTDHIWEKPWLNKILATIVNATRSIPFIILLILLLPFTKVLVQTSVGATSMIPPLALAAVVFMARLTENALLEVPHGLIEAAQSAGANNWQIIRHVLLPEAGPGLIQAVTVMIISLVGYSAMAGAVGGGGLGDLSIRYGYQRNYKDVMAITVVILIVAVQVIQSLGDYLAQKYNRK